MADKKISQLTALSAANLAPSTDVLAIVDTSATETKKIVAQDLINGVLNVASAVGIGTSSPGKNLEVAAATDTTIRIRNTTTTLSSAVYGTLDWATSDTSAPGGIVAKIDTFDDFSGAGFGDRAALRFFTNNSTALAERGRFSSDGTFRVKGAGTAGSTDAFQVSGSAPADAARITSGGQFQINTTSGGYDGALLVHSGTSTLEVFSCWNSATTGDNELINFFTDAGTGRGSITYNRAGGLVVYNTTSDYRAKDVYGLLDDSGEVIDALKVYRGKMHGATMERPMLIAHEAQEAAPYAVTGEKDAVNDDGTPKFQQMDTSSLVPLLIAEIQSLRSRVSALEAQ